MAKLRRKIVWINDVQNLKRYWQGEECPENGIESLRGEV